MIWLSLALALSRAQATQLGHARPVIRYALRGSDTYEISRGASIIVVYAGTERLRVSLTKSESDLAIATRYLRLNATRLAHRNAGFYERIGANGATLEQGGSDPDFLTLLNQPMRAWIDRKTLHALVNLRTNLPFEAPSPLGGTLLGTLEHDRNSAHPNHVVLSFSATGLMLGKITAQATLFADAAITMHATGFYARQSGLLDQLWVTLRVNGTLRGVEGTTPLRIIYRRRFKRINGEPRPPKMRVRDPRRAGAVGAFRRGS